MEKARSKKSAYEVIYNYRYMLETGYSFDEYAQTIAYELDKQKERENDTVRKENKD
jgi:hypothetical protein